MILRCVRKNIFEGLVRHITDNGVRDEFSASINFNISVNNDIFRLTIYPEVTNRKKYLCILQAVKIHKFKENPNCINIQLITDKKVLENLANILISDYITSLSREAVMS